MNNEDMALRLAALRVLIDYMQGQYDQVRAEAAGSMRRGERIVARSPLDDDQKIAVIPKSEPKPRVTVTDEAALTQWMADNYPDQVSSGYQIIGSEREVVDVLFRAAPHLLRRAARLDGEALSQLRTAAAAIGHPIGPGGEADLPGIEVSIPDGVVTCRPAPGALDIIRDLHDRGVLLLDGTIRREIAP